MWCYNGLMSMKKASCFWIYILELENGNYYTGYTNNLVRRYRQHVTGKESARYTKSFRPIGIAQCWRLFDTVGSAIRVEALIKKRSRLEKENMVKNPVLLKKLVQKRLDADVKIFPFAPGLVEAESFKDGCKGWRRKEDPFARLPAEDLSGLKSSE